MGFKLSTIRNDRLIRAIFDTVDDGVALIGADFKIIYQNEVIRKYYGGSVGKQCYKVYHGRKTPCEDCILNEVISTGKQKRYIKQSKFGDVAARWLEINSSPFKDDTGNIIGVVEAVRDVTEQKMANDLLAKALKERNEILVNHNNELMKAASYVKSMLPQPTNSGPIRTDWVLLPSVFVGGDSFGYHWIDEDHFAICFIDVSGHGIEAALLSASVINFWRAHHLQDTVYRKPKEVLAALNRAFPCDQHNNLFFTSWYGVYTLPTRTLEYASAGHPPALLIFDMPDGQIKSELLTTHNSALGVCEDIEFKSDTLKLKPSSRLYVFSDGVYEIIQNDGSIWGFKKFVEFMAQPEHFESSTLKCLTDHTSRLSPKGCFNDDFTILEFVFL